MVNLFKAAAQKTVAEIKKTKPKGTTFELPRELDDNGTLVGDSKKLNRAVKDLLDAAKDEKAAKTKAGVAKAVLLRHCSPTVIQNLAHNGMIPATPIKFSNHEGESVTYVIQDKTQQNELKPEQIERIQELLGDDKAAEIIVTEEVYQFNPKVMNQEAPSQKTDEDGNTVNETVGEVIFDVVSSALENCDRLTDEQKEALFDYKVKSNLIKNIADLAPQLIGKDAGKIEELLEIASSQVVRYVKT